MVATLGGYNIVIISWKSYRPNLYIWIIREITKQRKANKWDLAPLIHQASLLQRKPANVTAELIIKIHAATAE